MDEPWNPKFPKNGFKLESFVTISLALATKLSKLHALNILHNGVKPANVVLEMESQSVRFTSLEEATRIRRNANSVNSLTGIEEMLAYAPPERSGRIESPIDDRSDLYSLGITLFQLASGELPFSDKDKGALVYAHIALITPAVKTVKAGSSRGVFTYCIQVTGKKYGRSLCKRDGIGA